MREADMEIVRAQELNGRHIGSTIVYRRQDGRVITMEQVNMILHKKNGNVLVRWHPNCDISLNKEVLLRVNSLSRTLDTENSDR